MSLYRCSDGDRIDLIVLKHYGTLDPLNEVIKANPNLYNKEMTLKAGDKIELPDFETSFSNSNVVDESDGDSLLW